MKNIMMEFIFWKNVKKVTNHAGYFMFFEFVTNS